jgi:chromosome segregation ATPase
MNNFKKIALLLSFCVFAIYGSGQSSKLEQLIKDAHNTHSEFLKAFQDHAALQKQFDDLNAKQDFSAESQDKLLKLQGAIERAKETRYETQIKHLQAATVLQKEQLDICRQENAKLLAERERNRAEIEKLLKEKAIIAGQEPTPVAQASAGDSKKILEDEIYNLEHKKEVLEDEINELQDEKSAFEHKKRALQKKYNILEGTEDLYSARKPYAPASKPKIPVPPLQLKAKR